VSGFTLAEMLVATVVLIVIVLFITSLVNHAAVITSQGTKHMDTESNVRPFFDRLAVDIDQMVKRTDVSYYLKNKSSAGSDINDRMAFFSSAPGYYSDNTGQGDCGDPNKVANCNSRYSVVAYRVNTDPKSASYNKAERMAKGLPLNASPYTDTPFLFFDNTNATTIDTNWPTATRPSPDPNYYSADLYQKYELIGPQVFRFEYYYLTSASPATLVASPTNWTSANAINIKDIAAIVVAVAAIDPQSRKLLTEPNVQNIANLLPKFTSGGPGALLAQWQTVLNSNTTINAMPDPALQGIRIYERYFYLNQ
jgi:hypothetical protein